MKPGILAIALLLLPITARSQAVASSAEDSTSFETALNYAKSLLIGQRWFVSAAPFYLESPNAVSEGANTITSDVVLLERRRRQLSNAGITEVQRYGRGNCPGTMVPVRTREEHAGCPKTDSTVVAIGFPRAGGVSPSMPQYEPLSLSDFKTARLLILRFSPYGVNQTSYDVILRREGAQWSFFKAVPLLIVE